MPSAGDSLRRLAIRAERFERQWPQDAADLVERAVTQSLRSATGDGALSNDKGGGRATVTIRRQGTTTTVEADGNRGVWAILEHGTKAHEIRAARGKVLATPRGPRPRVRVSGVRPRRTWAKGVEASSSAVHTSARQAVDEVINGG